MLIFLARRKVGKRYLLRKWETISSPLLYKREEKSPPEEDLAQIVALRLAPSRQSQGVS